MQHFPCQCKSFSHKIMVQQYTLTRCGNTTYSLIATSSCQKNTAVYMKIIGNDSNLVMLIIHISSAVSKILSGCGGSLFQDQTFLLIPAFSRYRLIHSASEISSIFPCPPDKTAIVSGFPCIYSFAVSNRSFNALLGFVPFT